MSVVDQAEIDQNSDYPLQGLTDDRYYLICGAGLIDGAGLVKKEDHAPQDDIIPPESKLFYQGPVSAAVLVCAQFIIYSTHTIEDLEALNAEEVVDAVRRFFEGTFAAAHGGEKVVPYLIPILDKVPPLYPNLIKDVLRLMTIKGLNAMNEDNKVRLKELAARSLRITVAANDGAKMVQDGRMPQYNSKTHTFAQFHWDDAVMIIGLTTRVDLNYRAARVIRPMLNAKERIGVELMIGDEKVSIKEGNLVHIPGEASLAREIFRKMPYDDKQCLSLFFHANEASTIVAPGVRVAKIS